MNKNMLSKTLVMGVIVLFVGVSISTSTGKIDTINTIMNDGSLLGYVNDTSGNPIEGALVRVYFHGTYEEDYSDEYGFYHVTNIPICWCMKNATCSKDGYKTEWILLSIVENTTHDFVLSSENQAPEAPMIDGPVHVKPGQTLVYTFNAVDPDGDNVSYYIEWGDGTSDGWTDYYLSGADVTFAHTWEKKPKYLRVKAKDIYEAEGNWTVFVFPDKSSNLELNNVEDCDCKKFSDIDFNRLDKLTEIKDLINKNSIIRELNSENDSICILLLIRYIQLMFRAMYLHFIMELCPQGGTLYQILWDYIESLGWKTVELWEVAIKYECEWLWTKNS